MSKSLAETCKLQGSHHSWTAYPSAFVCWDTLRNRSETNAPLQILPLRMRKAVISCNLSFANVRSLSWTCASIILLLQKFSFENLEVHGCLKPGLCSPSECSIGLLRIFSFVAGFFYEVPSTAMLVQESFLEQIYLLVISLLLGPRLKLHPHQ